MSIDRQLRELIESGLERTVIDTAPRPGGRVLINDRECLDFCSNDYLGLARDERLVSALNHGFARFGAGSGAARLLSGSRPLVRDFEKKYAALTGQESSLLFNSGYHANTGLIPAITTDMSTIFSDDRNHASIVDGCRLSPARTVVYPHVAIDSLEKLVADMAEEGELDLSATNLFVTEGLFSMEGDSPDIDALIRLKNRFGILLYVDDAHGFGTVGADGKGTFAGRLEEVDILMATFGKAAGLLGACASAQDEIIRLARSRARTFIFSTALPPGLVRALSTALDLVHGEEGEELRARLASNAALFRRRLRSSGVPAGPGSSHVVPVVLGAESRAVDAAARLLAGGRVFCRAIRYPTAPLDEARLRFSITACHEPDSLVEAAAVVAEVIGC